MKAILQIASVCIFYLSSCCCDDTIPPEPAVDNCPYFYQAVSLSDEAKVLPPFNNLSNLKFRHRLGDTVFYTLDSLVVDSVHLGCDTLFAFEQRTAFFSTSASVPAQPKLEFKLLQEPIVPIGREIFAFSSGVNFNPQVYLADFAPLTRDDRSKFHEKIIDCDTAFYNVYELSNYNWKYGGFYKIYYSKTKGIEALVGGTNSFDYWVRIYE
jgi:hypothetical protein